MQYWSNYGQQLETAHETALSKHNLPIVQNKYTALSIVVFFMSATKEIPSMVSLVWATVDHKLRLYHFFSVQGIP